MRLNEEQRCLLWLSLGEIASDRIDRLIEKEGSARAIWQRFAQTGKLSANDAVNATLARYHSAAALDGVLEDCRKLGAKLLFRDDPRFPDSLRAIDDPPELLYALGDLNALERPCVGVVGTRFPTQYGRDMARSLAFGLAEARVCVVSGMARGIDGCAHEGTLEADGATAAVLGSGVNMPYPTENAALYHSIIERGGLVLSEYPLGAEPLSFHFPHRNRIISGLCRGVVFVEGKVKSGGMLTVGAALQQGREVFAVPGRVGQLNAEGPLTILREGARLVTSAADVLEDLGLPSATERNAETAVIVSPERQTILDALLREPMTLDELCAQTQLSADRLMAELSMLEIVGTIRRESGNRFSLVVR